MISGDWYPAYVGIGSNLCDPERQVRSALEELGGLSDSLLVLHSRLYRSAPMGPQDQPDYVNAVAGLLTRSSAEALVRALHTMEDQHGRDRSVAPWGPRTLDLDLLVFADQTACSESLSLPHPGIAERAFVILPLAEIAPALWVPGVGRAARLAKAFDARTLEALS